MRYGKISDEGRLRRHLWIVPNPTLYKINRINRCALPKDRFHAQGIKIRVDFHCLPMNFSTFRIILTRWVVGVLSLVRKYNVERSASAVSSTTSGIWHRWRRLRRRPGRGKHVFHSSTAGEIKSAVVETRGLRFFASIRYRELLDTGDTLTTISASPGPGMVLYRRKVRSIWG